MFKEIYFQDLIKLTGMYPVKHQEQHAGIVTIMIIKLHVKLQTCLQIFMVSKSFSLKFTLYVNA